MVVGIIAVPDDFEYQEDHQYAIGGNTELRMLVLDQKGIDRTEEGRGQLLGHFVTQPIWRVNYHLTGGSLYAIVIV